MCRSHATIVFPVSWYCLTAPSQYYSKCKCSRIICGVYIINWKGSLNFIIALIGGVIIRVSASNARANRHQDISALRQIGTWTNRHRTLGKSTPSLTNRHFWKFLMYYRYHVYSTFSKKNSQILVNKHRSTCLPIVGEISVNDFPTVCHLFYYYLISWLTLNWNSLGPLIICYDYFNNNQDYIFFNFYCLKLQHE